MMTKNKKEATSYPRPRPAKSDRLRRRKLKPKWNLRKIIKTVKISKKDLAKAELEGPAMYKRMTTTQAEDGLSCGI